MRGMAMGTSWQYGEGDYRAIEDALMRSDYGRWFLDEYLTRNRSGETGRLLAALDRLEASLAEAAAADPLPRLQEIALEIDAALEGTLSQLGPGAVEAVGGSNTQVDSILEAVEDIDGFLGALHMRHVNLRLAEKIRARLAEIQSACGRVGYGDAPVLATVLRDLRRRLAGVSAELATEAPSRSARANDGPCIPGQLIDELAAVFCYGETVPSAG